MAKAARKTARIVRGSGNVFADLDLPNAAELDTKARLVFAVNRVRVARNFTPARTAALLRINQPAMSALASYRIDKFSVERLMGFVTALGCDIEIRIKSPARVTAKKGRILVAGM